MKQKKLLVVDDDPGMGNYIGEVARELGFETDVATNTGEFVRAYSANPTVIVLDLMMPETDGVEHLRYLSEVNCEAAILLISGFDSGVLHAAENLAVERGLRVVGSMQKPISPADLRRALMNTSVRAANQAQHCVQAPSVRELAVAITNGDIIVHYQPQFAIGNRGLVGVEALARWPHPERGMIGPNTFIPLAENSGLIEDLTMLVLNQSLAQCAKWAAAGVHTRISVNMSTYVVAGLDMPERITELVKQHGLEPSQLILEVTEGGLMQELTTAHDILTRLRMKGIRLSIDDFGTGYSSMKQLHKVPFSELKIDRSFIVNADSDQEARAIVETTILLGHRLGMTVVAEGVETEAVMNLLGNLKCDVAQGYLLGRPRAAADALPSGLASREV